MIRELVETGKYVLVNGSEKSQGGTITRIDPSNSQKGSCLDLFIVSEGLFKYIDKLEIDSKREFSPFFVNNKFEKKFSDHLSCILSFKNLPAKSNKVGIPKETRWNTNTPGGWKQYTELTQNNRKLEEIASNAIFCKSDEIETSIEKELNNVKYQAFGKISTCLKKFQPCGRLTQLETEKKNILSGPLTLEAQDKLLSVNVKIKEALVESERESIASHKTLLNKVLKCKGRSAQIFRQRETILGNKMKAQEIVAVRNVSTNELVTNVSEIKEITLKYCKDLLTNREPKEEYIEVIRSKEEVHKVRMLERNKTNEIQFTQEMFFKSLDELRKKKVLNVIL